LENEELKFKCSSELTVKDVEEWTKIILKKIIIIMRSIAVIVILALSFRSIFRVLDTYDVPFIEAVYWSLSYLPRLIIYSIILLFSWKMPYIYSWFYIYRYNNQSQKKYKNFLQTIYFYESYYSISSTANDLDSLTAIKYLSISNVYVSKNLYIIQSANLALAISKKYITSTNKDDFISFLEQKVRNTSVIKEV